MKRIILIVTATAVLLTPGTALASGRFLTGDINRSGSVDLTDMSLLLNSYNHKTKRCLANHKYRCDLNKDGVVNIFDLSLLLHNYGK